MTKRMIDILIADGLCKAGLFTPGGGVPKAAVILFMDIFGPRPALDAMAGRLVSAGYAVLVPDLFHRFGERPVFEPKTAFADEATKARLFSMLRETTQAMTIADTGAFLDAFSAEGYAGPVGVAGYCMGGARALNVAASYPRIAAAASFHGGNLASDAEDSPHRRVEGPHLCRRGRRGRFLPARAGGKARRGAASSRGRPRHRELCRDEAWLVRAGPFRL